MAAIRSATVCKRNGTARILAHVSDATFDPALQAAAKEMVRTDILTALTVDKGAKSVNTRDATPDPEYRMGTRRENLVRGFHLAQDVDKWGLLSPEDQLDLASIGREMMDQGHEEPEDWKRAMTEILGPEVEPSLDDVWKATIIGRPQSSRFADAMANLAAGGDPVPDAKVPQKKSRRIPMKSLPNPVVEGVLGIGDAFQKGLAPATLDRLSKVGGDLLRHRASELRVENAKAYHFLQPYRPLLDKLIQPTFSEVQKIAEMGDLDKPEDRAAREAALLKFSWVRFIHSVETFIPEHTDENGELVPEEGLPYDSPELEKAGEALRKSTESARDTALALGGLRGYLELYFAHMYRNVGKAEDYIATFNARHRSPLGNKSWSKQREHPTMLDALQACLFPKHRNPIDFQLEHIYNVRRWAMMQQLVKKDLMRARMAYPLDADVHTPPTWEDVDPRLGEIVAKPVLEHEEYYDDLLYGKLKDFAKRVGIKQGREPGVGGPLGVANMKTAKVLTKTGSPMSVLVHEIGHALDGKYGIWGQIIVKGSPNEKLLADIVKNGATPKERGAARKALADIAKRREELRGEMRNLADLRWEGTDSKDVAEGYKKYARNRKEQIANLFDAYVNHRERLHDVAPTVFGVLEDVLKKNGLDDFISIRPSLVLGSAPVELDVPGKRIIARWIVPKSVNRLINNYLSPGWQQNKFYHAALAGFSSFNQFQLGFSLFHVGMTGIDSMISRGATGLSQAINEGGPAAIKSGTAKMATPFLAPLIGLKKGQQIMEAAGLSRGVFDLERFSLHGDESPEVKAIVEMAKRAGMNFEMDPNYSHHLTQKWLSGLRQFLAQAKAGRHGPAAKEFAVAVLRTPWAVMEAAAYPIMSFWVPRIKLYAFAEAATAELHRLGPDATQAEQNAALRRVSDSSDDRMGQVAYDNFHWNRAIKDAFQIMLRSPGWTIGSLRLLGGAVYDTADMPFRLVRRHKELAKRAEAKKEFEDAAEAAHAAYQAEHTIWQAKHDKWEEDGKGREPQEPPPPKEKTFNPKYEAQQLEAPILTQRQAYFLFGAMFLAMAGGSINFLRTGQFPKEWRDFYFPRTGGVNRDGSPERYSLPTYTKDLVAWTHNWSKGWAARAATIVKVTGDKLNPGIQAIHDLTRAGGGREFPNNRIYDPEAGAMDQAKSIGKYLLRSHTPIGAKQLTEPKNPGSAIPDWGPAFGIIRAPGYVTDSPLQSEISQWRNAHQGAPIPQEEADKRQATRDLEYELRGTPKDEWASHIPEGMPKSEKRRLTRNAARDRLQISMRQILDQDLPGALSMIEKYASPEELAVLRPDLQRKMSHSKSNWGKSLSLAQREATRARLRALLDREPAAAAR